MIYRKYTDIQLIRMKQNLDILCGRLGAGPESNASQQLKAIKAELARRVASTPIRTAAVLKEEQP